jgi:formate dehydrogenase iron-sulfur subunit
MSVRVFVPSDSAALSVGAGAVASVIADEAARRGLDITIVRNGARGMMWLEPLVEVETPAGRVGYGPVRAADVTSLFDAGFLTGGAHALSIGVVAEHPYLARQERLCFARVGVTDPLSWDDYVAHGGSRGLQAALAMSGADAVAAVTESGLRGRGGAAFPTGIKWKTVLDTAADRSTSYATRTRATPARSPTAMTMEGRSVPPDRGHDDRRAS